MSRLRYAARSALTLASIVILCVCTAQPGGFADLGGERDARDELPQLADYAYDSVDRSTSRYVGEHDGASLWLANGRERSAVCLVADAGERGWIVGCGGGGTRIGGTTGSYEVVEDAAAAPKGAVKISQNVYAW
ncbi:hypothetical protein CW368_05210 [Actinomycetales bacterium SN12]|nr:hypothetical protein CW368_05210 [Actinomycetales bacterium SN12]